MGVLTISTVARHVGERSLKDASADGVLHALLEQLEVFPGLLRLVEEVVCGPLDGTHEGAHLFRVLMNEAVVGDVEDRAEAATAELGQLVDSEHLDVGFGSVLLLAPVFELDLCQARFSN